MWSRRYGRNASTAGLAKKKPEDIPLLHFGDNNNFHKFREALSKAVLREYRQFGKLSELDEYYSPTMPTRVALGVTDDMEENKLLFHEAVTAYLKLQRWL